MDFRITGKDSGNNNAASVQPVLNGEDANQTVFQRPSENLRTRTEVIRKTVDNILAEMQADRGLCVMSWSDTKVYFGGGKFRLNTAGTDTASTRDLVIAPIAGSFNGNPPPGSPIQATYYYADTQTLPGAFKAVAKSTIHAYNGGNNLWIKIFKNARVLASPVVTVEGADGGGSYPADGPVTICVEIDKDNLNTIQDVVLALRSDSSPSATYLDTVLTVWLANETNPAEERTQRLFSTDPGGMAAVDNECYRISAAEIDNFFQTLAKTMAEGDSLVIAFPTIAARRACTYSPTIGAYLQIISEDSRTLAAGHVVPICKYYLNRLIFLNGVAVDEAGWVYLVHGKQMDTDLRADLAAATGNPKGDYMIGADAKTAAGGMLFPLSLGTVHSQVQSIIDKLTETVSSPGDTRIGAAAKTYGSHTLPAGSVQAQVAGLLNYYNNHITAVDDKHPVQDLSNRPYVIVDAAGNGDYTTLEDAVFAVEELALPKDIFIRNGTYTPNWGGKCIGRAANKNYNITGESRTGTIISGRTDGAWSAIQADTAAPLNAKVVFSNLTIQTTSTAGTMVYNPSDPPYYPDYDSGLVFQNCQFRRPSPCTARVISNRGNLRFFQCSFSSASTLTTIEYISSYRHSTYDPEVIIDHCFIENTCAFMAGAPGSGDVESGRVRVRHCKFTSCNYGQTLFDFGLPQGVTHVDCELIHNDFRVVNLVVVGRGRFNIADNRIDGRTPDSAGQYLIDVGSYEPTVHHTCHVHHNQFIGGSSAKHGAIRVYDGAVDHNSFVEVYSSPSSDGNPTPVIKAVSNDYEGCLVAHNRIQHSADDTSAANTFAIDLSGDFVTCIGNYLGLGPGAAGHHGIGVSGCNHFVVSDNVIIGSDDAATGSFAVSASATYGTIRGNVIRHMWTGIYLGYSCRCVVVDGNTVEVNGLSNAECVTFQAVTANQSMECSVSNNILGGWNSAGIDCGSSIHNWNIHISGNLFRAAANKILHAQADSVGIDADAGGTGKVLTNNLTYVTPT